MAITRSSLARDLATVGVATLLSRVLGFARDLGIASVLGAGALSDAFFAAMLIPNLFRRLLSEGALNSAFVPIWLRLRSGGDEAARRFGEEALGTMILALGSITLIGAWLSPMLVHAIAPGFASGEERFELAASYLRIVLPYATIAGVVAIAAAALNAEARVGAVSFGLVVYNVVAVAAIALIALARPSLDAGAILSAAVVLAGLAQLLVVGAALLRLPSPPLHPRVVSAVDTRRFFALALPGIIAAGIPQLKLIAGAMVASSSQSAVSWLYYAYRLYELPLGVVSVAIASVMAPWIAASVRADRETACRAQCRAFELAVGLALPAAFGIGVLAHPIAASLYEHGEFGPRDTEAVAAAISAIAAGLPGHGLEKVLGSICFAHEDTRTPMWTALAGLVAAISVALMLFPQYGHVGVALAIAASGWVGAILLGLVLARRRRLSIQRATIDRLMRIVVIAILMGLATYAAKAPMALLGSSVPARIAELAALVVLGLAVYGIGLQTLGVVQMRELVAALRQDR
jgi:putative peptidoglycan lipid II flippase